MRGSLIDLYYLSSKMIARLIAVEVQGATAR